KHIVAWYELHGDNYESQFIDIFSYLTKIKRLAKVVVDATGLGAPLYDRFNSAFTHLPVELVPHVFSESSNSEMYKALLADLITGRITFPYSPAAQKNRHVRKFVVQMLDAEKEIKP